MLTVAFVTDSLNRHSIDQLKSIEKKHVVCMFLPQTQLIDYYDHYQIRKFTDDIQEPVFQRYDIVVFYSFYDWNVIMPIIRKVKGIAIVDGDSAMIPEISGLTAMQISPTDDAGEAIKLMPRHIHWYDREIKLISDRLGSFGLLTDEVKQNFQEIYGVPMLEDWLSKGRAE